MQTRKRIEFAEVEVVEHFPTSLLATSAWRSLKLWKEDAGDNLVKLISIPCKSLISEVLAGATFSSKVPRLVLSQFQANKSILKTSENLFSPFSITLKRSKERNWTSMTKTKVWN